VKIVTNESSHGGIAMKETSQRISRRALLKVTFATGLGAGVLASIGAVASFLYPSVKKGPGRILLGSVTTFPLGSKTFFNVVEGKSGLDAARVNQRDGFRGRDARSRPAGVFGSSD
jgi:hypothetical protein